jgi:hypothetical protein
VVVIMSTNREFSNALLVPGLLLAVACGGKDVGRPTGDSMVVTKDAALEDCAAEAELPILDSPPAGPSASGYRIRVMGGSFDTSATGWLTRTDYSPKPASAPRPIKLTCPKDSTYDCCMYSDTLWDQYDANKDSLTADQQQQVEQERALEKGTPGKKGYKCLMPLDLNAMLTGLGSVPTPVPLDRPIACRQGDQSANKAVHIRGARFTDWGAQFMLDYENAGKKAPIDASMYDGISFWVRLGQGGTQTVGSAMFFVVEDVFTKENKNKYEIVVDEATKTFTYVLDAAGKQIQVGTELNCYDAKTQVDGLKCDRYGAGVGLETEWRFVKIPFASMGQRGFGVKSPIGRPYLEQLLGLGFYLDINNWDLWIDEVAFYKDPVRTD